MMKIQGKKFISGACSLAMIASSFTGLAQSTQQEKSQERAPRKVEKSEQHEMIIVQTDGAPPEFNVMVPPPPMTPGSNVFFQGGGAQTFEFISSEMSFDSKIVKGAPYSADAVTETTQTLTDGNRLVHRTSSQVYRDGEGRTRREQTFNAIGPWAAGSDAPKVIFIHDPVTDVSYTLDPHNKTATKTVMRVMTRETSSLPSAMKIQSSTEAGGSLPRKMSITSGVLQGNAIKKVNPVYPPIAKAAKAEGPVQVAVTVNEAGEVTVANAVSGHPLLREAAADAARHWAFKPTAQTSQAGKVSGVLTFNFALTNSDQEPANDVLMSVNSAQVMMRGMHGLPGSSHKAKKESLGKQMIEGVEAEGTRFTTTIPAGEIGNERPIEIVSEVWYSAQLQTDVMRRNFDPRTGETVYKLTNIVRNEPDHALFELPADYTIKEGGPGGGAFRYEFKRQEN